MSELTADEVMVFRGSLAKVMLNLGQAEASLTSTRQWASRHNLQAADNLLNAQAEATRAIANTLLALTEMIERQQVDARN